jgi:hypothetical protein
MNSLKYCYTTVRSLKLGLYHYCSLNTSLKDCIWMQFTYLMWKDPDSTINLFHIPKTKNSFCMNICLNYMIHWRWIKKIIFRICHYLWDNTCGGMAISITLNLCTHQELQLEQDTLLEFILKALWLMNHYKSISSPSINTSYSDQFHKQWSVHFFVPNMSNIKKCLI